MPANDYAGPARNWGGGGGRWLGRAGRFFGWAGVAFMAWEAYDWWRHNGVPIYWTFGGWTQTLDCGFKQRDWRVNVTPNQCLTGQGVQGTKNLWSPVPQAVTGIAFFNEYDQFPDWVIPGWQAAMRTVDAYTRPAGVTTQPLYLPAQEPYPWQWPTPLWVPRAITPQKPLVVWPEMSDGGQPAAPEFKAPEAVSWSFRPGGRTRSTAAPLRRPPRRRQKEKKLRMTRGVRALWHAVNAATEINDAVGALFDAIGDSECKRKHDPKDGKAATPQQKWAAVYGCFGSIDWDTAVFNLVYQQFSDLVWAQVGIPTKELGLQVGQNMGLNRNFNHGAADEVGEALKGLDDWLRGHLEKLTGLSLTP